MWPYLKASWHSKGDSTEKRGTKKRWTEEEVGGQYKTVKTVNRVPAQQSQLKIRLGGKGIVVHSPMVSQRPELGTENEK